MVTRSFTALKILLLSATFSYACVLDVDCTYGEVCKKIPKQKFGFCMTPKPHKKADLRYSDANRTCSSDEECSSGFLCDWEHGDCIKLK